jgi:outer membrane protein assembly factor BamA
VRKRWRAVLFLFALLISFALIEVLSAQAARALSRSLLALGRFGFTLHYQSARVSFFRRSLLAESLVLRPAGEKPPASGIRAKSLKVWACSTHSANGYCFALEGLGALMIFGDKRDEAGPPDLRDSAERYTLSAEKGSLYGVFRPLGESEWKMTMDSVTLSSPLLEWTGAVSATAKREGNRWQLSALLASLISGATNHDKENSLPPRIRVKARETSTGWQATATGEAYMHPRGFLARHSSEPWRLEQVNLAFSGEQNVLRLEPSSLRIFGVSLRAQARYDAITGGYGGEIVATGDLPDAASHFVGAPFPRGHDEWQWTVDFEGSPEGTRVGWSTSPAFTIIENLPPIDSASVTLPGRYPGEPWAIQDLIVTTPYGDYRANGFYDENARILHLSGSLNLSAFAVPGLPVSPDLRGQVSVSADFSNPDTPVSITLEKGRVDPGAGFSINTTGSIVWSQKGWKAEGSFDNAQHSVRFRVDNGRMTFFAKGGDPDGTVSHWLEIFAGSRRRQPLPAVASSVSVSEYELTGSFNFADGQAEVTGFAALAHPEGDLWSSFDLFIWNDAGKFQWKVHSEGTTLAIPLGVRLSGGFLAEGTANSLSAFSAFLEGDGMRLDAEYGDGVLRANLHASESFPRGVSTMLRLLRAPLPAETALIARLTRLNALMVSAEYRPQSSEVDLRASIHAENTFLGVQAQISELALHWNPVTWSANLTGDLYGQRFKITADRVEMTPDEITGNLRAQAQELNLSELQAVLSALGAKSEWERWLSGSVSGTANIVASGGKAGAVSFEVSEWHDGPVPVDDLWLSGSLSLEDLILSGTGKISGIPVGLSAAFSHPYDPSREGTLVVSADHLPLSQLPFGNLPDLLREAILTGYLQAIVTPDRQSLSGEGALRNVTSSPFLPRDFSISLEGNFDNARIHVHSDDGSVTATATLGVSPPFPLAANYTVNRRGALSSSVTDFEISATGSLQVSLLPFSLSQMEATASRFRTTILGEEWSLSEPATVSTTDGKTFSVSPLRLTSTSGELAFSGDIWRANTVQFGRATLEAHLPLTLFQAFFPEVASEGTLNASLSWADEPSAFPARGSLEVYAREVSHPILPDALGDVFARVRLDRETFEVEEGRFLYSDGTGRFDAVGALSSTGLDYFTGSVSLENFRIPYPAIQNSFASAFLRLTGTPDELYISGDISVAGGELRLTTVTTPTNFQTPIPIRLNLSVSLSEPLRVTAEGFQSEMTGSVAVRGTADLPLAFGQLGLSPGGNLRVAGRSFTIQSGSVRFTGYSLLPEISLRAVRDEPPYTIYLNATGTPPDLVAEFSSSPPLTTPSILSVLATGRTLEEIQNIAPGETESFLSLGLQGLLSAGLEQRLFDRVSTRSATIGGKKLPVMTLGKAIKERFFTQYTFDLSSGAPEEVSFSYRLHPWELQVVQGRSESPTFTITYRGAAILPAVPEKSATYTLTALELQVQPANADLLASLQHLVKFHPGDRVSRAQVQSLRSSLKALLASRGYLGARVSLNISVDSENKTLSATIIAEPGKVKTVVLTAPPGLPGDTLILRLTHLWEVSPSDDTFLRSAIRNLPAILENEGWQMESCEAKITDGEETQASFTLRAFPLPRIEAVRLIADQPIDLPREIQMRLRKGSPWQPLALQEALSIWTQNEHARGYREFQASPSVVISAEPVDGRRTAEVTLSVIRGPLFQIRELAIQPPEAANKELQLLLNTALVRDRTASAQNILNLRQILSRHFREDGYADAFVSVREKPAPDHSLDLIFRVDAGRRVVVTNIFVDGSLSSSDKAHFSALLSQFIGRPLSPSLESQIRKLLSSSGFPSAYEIRVIRGEPQDNLIPASLHIRLIRVAPFTYSASLGYGSSSGVAVTLSGTLQGIFTPWQSLGFSGRLSHALKNADLTFNDPRFQFRDYTARLRIFAERAVNSDFVIHTRLGGIEVTRTAEPARSRFTGSLQLQRLSYSGATFQPPDTALVLNLAYLRDRRDSVFNPWKGDLFSLSVKFGQDLPVRKPVFGRASLHFVRALPVASKVSLFSRLYAGYGFHLPLGERFFYTRALGVRGFNPDRLNPRDKNGNSLGGQIFALAGLEARWRAHKTWGALAFIDSGGLFERPTDFRLASIALSTGAGFFYITPLGPIRLEYQVPLKPEDRSGKNEIFLGFSFTY